MVFPQPWAKQIVIKLKSLYITCVDCILILLKTDNIHLHHLVEKLFNKKYNFKVALFSGGLIFYIFQLV